MNSIYALKWKPKMTEGKNLWWGYKHISGTYQAKRYFDKRDIDEANIELKVNYQCL